MEHCLELSKHSVCYLVIAGTELGTKAFEFPIRRLELRPAVGSGGASVAGRRRNVYIKFK